MTESAEQSGAEIQVMRQQTDIAFRAIESFDDAIAASEEAFGAAEVASNLGDGFAVIEKAQLVGVGMILLYWNFYKSNLSDLPYVVVRAMTRDNRKVVFADGSSGIRDQLLEYTTSHEGRNGGVFAEKGLRASNYTTKIEDKGKEREVEATTYYVDTSMI